MIEEFIKFTKKLKDHNHLVYKINLFNFLGPTLQLKKDMKAVKYILKDSLFGQLFTLWTAPIDGEKLNVTSQNLAKKRYIAHNLIIAHKSYSR